MKPFSPGVFFVARHVVEGRGARVAHRAPGRAVTWDDVVDGANRWGNALVDLGVEIEQRVLLVLDDTPAFVTVFWGTVKIGAVAVPVNPLMTGDEYAFMLNDSRAKVVVVEERVAPAMLAVRDRCPHVRAIVVAGRAGTGALALDDLLGRAKTALAPAPTADDDVLYWGYTAGSPGRP